MKSQENQLLLLKTWRPVQEWNQSNVNEHIWIQKNNDSRPDMNQRGTLIIEHFTDTSEMCGNDFHNFLSASLRVHFKCCSQSNT